MKNDNGKVQFVKFLAVGVLNTLVTLIVIFLCKECTSLPLLAGNIIGYVAGLINSFIWNRQWVFRAAQGDGVRQAVRFAVGFLLCYGVQLAVVWGLMQWPEFMSITIRFNPITISGYGIATVIGMGVYTVSNFLFNRIVTFSKAT